MRYLGRRMLQALPVLIGLSLIIFIISRVVPGDPARMALGPFAHQEQVEALRRSMGLDRPLPIQYFNYLRGILQGDFGESLVSYRNVRLDLGHYLPATAELVTVTILWVFLIGVPLGALSAERRGQRLDTVVKGFSFAAVVIPAFIIGIALQLIFGYWLNWLPVTGRLDPATAVPPRITGFLLIDSLLAGDLAAFGDTVLHLILPSLSLACAGIGQVIRITRNSMLEIGHKDYIAAALATGFPSWLVTFRYRLKPAFVPTLQIGGLTFASLFGNAFLVEMVFAWPGMAKYGINALLQKDINAIVGVVLVIGAAFVVTNLVTDLLAGFVDPRIRLRGDGAR